MSAPQIRTGLPLPKKNRGRPKTEKWSFLDTMEVNEVAVLDDLGTPEERRALRKQLASAVSSRNGKKYAIRTCPNETIPDVQGVAVWRTK